MKSSRKKTVARGAEDQNNFVMLICELRKHDGTPPISTLPGLWYRRLDERWEFWVNGHLQPQQTEEGTPVGPGDCYVKFNGWPAGIFSLISGEGILAAGQIANQDTFSEALRGALARGHTNA